MPGLNFESILGGSRMETSNAADTAALDESIKTVQPVDVRVAAELLREAKQILDKQGITFALFSGTCLGAVRDNQLIPWDDDIDLGSVLGLNGLTEEKIERVADTFRDNGFIAGISPQDRYIAVLLLKDSVRIDWSSFRIIDDCTFHYPGVRIQGSMLRDLKEVELMGEKLKFHVPNPPEEYLRLKYGKDWTVPKKAGQYEADVLSQIPEGTVPGSAGRLKQFIIKHLLPWRATRIRVLDSKGRPVAGAEVAVAGLGRSRTNSQGYARLYVPRNFVYALVVRFANHEEVLYEEELGPGETYLYKPDVQATSGRYFTLTPENHP
jgi:hypothetical protein